MERFNSRISEGVRCAVSKLLSKSSIALRVLDETVTELRNPDGFVFQDANQFIKTLDEGCDTFIF